MDVETRMVGGEAPIAEAEVRRLHVDACTVLPGNGVTLRPKEPSSANGTAGSVGAGRRLPRDACPGVSNTRCAITGEATTVAAGCVDASIAADEAADRSGGGVGAGDDALTAAARKHDADLGAEGGGEVGRVDPSRDGDAVNTGPRRGGDNGSAVAVTDEASGNTRPSRNGDVTQAAADDGDRLTCGGDDGSDAADNGKAAGSSRPARGGDNGRIDPTTHEAADGVPPAHGDDDGPAAGAADEAAGGRPLSGDDSAAADEAADSMRPPRDGEDSLDPAVTDEMASCTREPCSGDAVSAVSGEVAGCNRELASGDLVDSGRVGRGGHDGGEVADRSRATRGGDDVGAVTDEATDISRRGGDEGAVSDAADTSCPARGEEGACGVGSPCGVDKAPVGSSNVESGPRGVDAPTAAGATAVATSAVVDAVAGTIGRAAAAVTVAGAAEAAGGRDTWTTRDESMHSCPFASCMSPRVALSCACMSASCLRNMATSLAVDDNRGVAGAGTCADGAAAGTSAAAATAPKRSTSSCNSSTRRRSSRTTSFSTAASMDIWLSSSAFAPAPSAAALEVSGGASATSHVLGNSEGVGLSVGLSAGEGGSGGRPPLPAIDGDAGPHVPPVPHAGTTAGPVVGVAMSISMTMFWALSQRASTAATRPQADAPQSSLMLSQSSHSASSELTRAMRGSSWFVRRLLMVRALWGAPLEVERKLGVHRLELLLLRALLRRGLSQPLPTRCPLEELRTLRQERASSSP